MQKSLVRCLGWIDHGAEVGYEVAWIPMTEDEAISNF